MTQTSQSGSNQAMQQRKRIRELLPKLFLGDFRPGPLNSLTDVPGIKVHTQEILAPKGTNTGVTCIAPRDDWLTNACYAGIFTFNGAGEMTGSHWIHETGLLHSPIVITNSLSIGAAHEGICRYAIEEYGTGSLDGFLLPVVAETFDGYLSDIASFAVRPEHIVHGLRHVSSGRVREGNVGGGTGMICHRFKGGTGSASRVVEGFDAQGGSKEYTVGALVQANYGKKEHLRIGGAPVGRILAAEAEEAARNNEKKRKQLAELEDNKNRKDGSIIIVLATDAPLNPAQLQRLARRATVGLGKVGGYGSNSSGDIFLAFSTGTEIPVESISDKRPAIDPSKPKPLAMEIVDDTSINGVLVAAADAVEESIYNALCMAEDLTGYQERKVEALPLDRLEQIMEKYM